MAELLTGNWWAIDFFLFSVILALSVYICYRISNKGISLCVIDVVNVLIIHLLKYWLIVEWILINYWFFIFAWFLPFHQVIVDYWCWCICSSSFMHLIYIDWLLIIDWFLIFTRSSRYCVFWCCTCIGSWSFIVWSIDWSLIGYWLVIGFWF